MKHTCLVCGGDMKHIKDRDWVCTECGADAWMGDYGCLCFDADLFDDEDDEIYCDEIPVGCAACGGDYPNCKTSCPMFDD